MGRISKELINIPICKYINKDQFLEEFKEFMKNSKVGIFNYIKYVRNIKRKNYYNICNVIVKISPKNTKPGFINNEFAFFDHYDSNIVSIYKKLM